MTDASYEVLIRRIDKLMDLTAEYWEPVRTRERYAGDGTWLSYTDAIPIIATTLPRLQALGPMGKTWWRYGRDTWLPLTEALDHWDDRIEYDARREAEQAKRAEKERCRREARRCPTCKDGIAPKPGEQCTDCAGRAARERWAARERADRERQQREQEERERAEARARIEEREAAKLGNRARALLRRATKTTAGD